jgi:copper chaperone
MNAPLESQTIAPAAAEELSYRVDGMSCRHCQVAVSGEVGRLAGVRSVEVDLESKLVRVSGERLDDAALRAAIDEAGYDAVPA